MEIISDTMTHEQNQSSPLPKIDIGKESPREPRSDAAESAALPKIDFAQLERVSRRALRMYDLTERERRISDVIIEWSFGRGRSSCVIPSLDAFVDLTGIAREDVSRTIDKLIMRRIVQRRGPRDERIYEFLPNASFWREAAPLFDAQRASDRAAELDRINGQLRLPVEEADLDDAMASVSRESALAEANDDEIGKSPMTQGVGKLPMTPVIGKSPTPTRDAHVRAQDVLQYVTTKRIAVHVGDAPQKQLRFRDDEKNYVFEQFESLAGRQERDREDFAQNRFTWLRRFRDQDFSIIRRAVGIVREKESDPKNKREKPVGAVLYRECVKLAHAAGKTFRMI